MAGQSLPPFLQVAGPAQAALNIETADPHTSVTFLSFCVLGSCTRYRELWRREWVAGEWVGLQPGTVVDIPDQDKFIGSGILGPYRGSEPPESPGRPPITNRSGQGRRGGPSDRRTDHLGRRQLTSASRTLPRPAYWLAIVRSMGTFTRPPRPLAGSDST